MKITNDAWESILQKYISGAGTKRVPGGPGGSVKSGAGVSISISDRARELAKIKDLLNRVPDIREDRVEKIRSQIELGLYDTSGRKVVDKLLKNKWSGEA